jgi:integrase
LLLRLGLRVGYREARTYDQCGELIDCTAATAPVHAMRHFFASWAIERGFSPKRVQSLLGHSSIQMTFDVYGHLFPSLEDDHAKFAAGELAVVG